MERRAMFLQLLRQAPVGTDAGKNLPVLHLSGHDSASNHSDYESVLYAIMG